MKRILVGVDGSKESRDAARLAFELAKATGAQLAVATVAEEVGALVAPELMVKMEQWKIAERERCAKVAKEIAGEIEGPGVAIETMVVDGAPAHALAELARTGDVDLVVVGHRGRGAVKRLLMGSVADRLAQICPKPVLVVR